MKKIILYIVTASVICCNYSCNKEVATDEKQAEELCAKLERAFRKSSTSNLEQFFIDWNTSVSSNADKQNDITKTIFEIYREFYSPLDLTTLSNWQWGDTNSKYVVIQNKVFYAVAEKELFDTYWRINRDSISDFRPTLNLAKEKILYLLPEYQKALIMFLGTEASNDNWKRYEFICPQIPIMVGHWGWYWHLAIPEVSLILLDTDKTFAKVLFSGGPRGGEAILEKKGNKWEIKECRATWIQ